MAYDATVLPVMIASPGDVLEERNVARDVIHEWNYINSIRYKTVLMPVGWDTHSSPELGVPAQDLINDHVLKDCDLLVGIFWTRAGTPTGKAVSGSIEEISRHVDAGKPAMVYFSQAPVAPQSLDQSQFAALQEFKQWCLGKGLVEGYANIVEFRQKFFRQLQIKINQNSYLNSLFKVAPGSSAKSDLYKFGRPTATQSVPLPELSEEAVELLLEASQDEEGMVLHLRTLGGTIIQANGRTFSDTSDRRSIARWEFAIKQLVDEGFLYDPAGRAEVFELTDAGFRTADKFRAHR